MSGTQALETLSSNNSYVRIKDRMTSYLHEWAGLSGGFKQAAIFYVTSAEIGEFRQFFEREGFCALASDFAYNYKDTGVEKTATNITTCSGFSLYVSRDEKIAHSLKELDHFHQFQIPPPKKSLREIFFEISSLLGYPPCCSRFLQNIHENPKFKSEVTGLGTLYSDETLYPMLALGQSERVDWRLTNFSEHVPRLISFFVCSYQCEHAIEVGQKVYEYWSEHDPKILEQTLQMRKPLLFFSPRRSFSFEQICKMDGKFHYGSARQRGIFDETLLKDSLYAGNQLAVERETIRIFKDNIILHSYDKKNPFDGVMIDIPA